MPAAPLPEVKTVTPAPVSSVPVTEVKVAKLAPLTPPPAAPLPEVRAAMPEPVAPGPIVSVTEVEVAALAPLAQPTASPKHKITVAELAPLAPLHEAPARAVFGTEAQPAMPVVAAPVAIEVAAISTASTVLVAGSHAVRQIQRAGKALAALLIPRKPHAAIESNRPEVLDNRNPVIEVSNGAGRRAMAARVREYLRNYGEHPQRLTNAKSFYHAETVVLFKPGFENKAQEIADLMPGEVATRTDPSLGRSDVRLRLGRDLIALDQQFYFSGLEI
jgi:hypothetical protein